MKSGVILLFSILFSCCFITAQDSTDLTISMLTCGPGDESYELFGHSAIRVQKDGGTTDIVYNYGTFDFNAPGFTYKFLRGKLDYFLNTSSMSQFMRTYLFQKRWVKEQVLDISEVDKQTLLQALETNALPENKFYKYDFFFNNCVTRIRDIVEDQVGSVDYGEQIDPEFTFRDLLHSHLAGVPWTRFGMDLILGVPTDRIVHQRGQMFLPRYYFDYMQEAQVRGKSLIQKEISLLEFENEKSKDNILSPYRLFLVLLIIEAIAFFLFYISGDYDFMRLLDAIWFWGLFLVFLIFAFMWFLTDHEVCRYNYNLIWTVPWSGYALTRKRRTRKLMFFLTILVLVLVLLLWKWIPQSMPTPIIFICLISFLKSLRQVGFNRWVNRIRRSGRLTTCITLFCLATAITAQSKITGISMVAPPQPFTSDPMVQIKQTNAEWVALIPFGFSRKGQPEVFWGSDRQWWGERSEGIEASIKLAKKNGLKVMLKPQVWIMRSWVGEMDFDEESDWRTWEDSYRAYLMTFVDLAVQYDVEMICLATEYKMAVQKRESYWRDLIAEIRKRYNGKLTYSANWDSYAQVPFWDALDYIGVSAYFPLSDMSTPMVMMLDYKWNKHVKKLKSLSEKLDKQILFTEYGYLSVDGAAGKTWELESKVNSLDINEKAQANAYEALFSEFYNYDFWAGGFLWKWFPEGQGHEGYPERDYTPQDKMAQKVLTEWHGKMNNK